MSPALRHRVRPRIRSGTCLLPPLSEGKVKEFLCVINAFNLSFNEYSWYSFTSLQKHQRNLFGSIPYQYLPKQIFAIPDTNSGNEDPDAKIFNLLRY